MPRGVKSPVDDRIAKVQEKIDKLNAKLDDAKREMKALEEEKASVHVNELISLIEGGNKSFDEIKEFLNS